MKYLFILILFIPGFISAQIKIDTSNREWSNKIDSALSKIKSIDTVYYSRLLSVCDNICYINKNFSTCKGSRNSKGTIKLSVNDLKRGEIDNICAAIVHESLHLKIRNSGIKMKRSDEETLCYSYELEFIMKISGVDRALIINAENHIMLFSSE